RTDGTEVPGWPAYTADAYMHYGAPAYQSGEITVPVYAAVLESPAVGDLDRDGSLEVVVGDFQGRISAFNRYGQMLPGFPARSNPAYSQAQRGDRESGFYAANPQFIPGDYPGGGALPNNPDLVPDLVNRKNKINSSTWWFLAAPSLGNIDPSDEALEIVGGAMDRHLYAFKMDGSAVPGWPVMLRDPAYVGSVDPLTHRVTNAPGVNNRRGAMIVTSVAIGDLTGDGVPEVVSGVNEQYDEPMNSDDTILPDVLAALGESGGNNRVYAVYADGSLHAGPAGSAHPHANAFLPGWPAKIASLTMELLPVVGEGPNGAPVMADVDGNGTPEVGIFGVLGPAYVLKGDGTSIYGRDDEGRDRTLLMQPFGPGANSVDTPSIPALGGGIFSQFQGEGIFSFACGAAGLGKFLDVILNDDQLLSDNHLSVWDLQGGRMLLPFFPREVNDLHFLCTPASADVDGDGLEEVLDATAYSDLHAFNALGEEPGLRILSPTGWPKFTAGWQFSSPSVGDFDGDGLRDIAVTTREAWLFVWRGNGATSCDPASWPEWGHDGWNSNNAHVDAVRPDRIADLSATQSTIPALARVEGGGNIPIGSGKGNFGIEAKLTEETLEGHLIFHDKAESGIKVKSNNITSVSIQADAALEWTAPGDGPCGATADHYEIRYAQAPITESTWAQANVLENNLTPQLKGSRESLALPNLPAGV
ncbi:MAG: VCBS repeat-containing protein, partial [Candidatus Hydrogenedentes bacterium]|nr:VCBS repeat-containing protein [Candidatus Hydrogenedentota bacterium]